MEGIKLSPRQEEIIRLVKEHQPITSENIALKLGVTRAALRADLSILTMCDILEARPNVGYIFSVKKVTNHMYDLIIDIKVKDIMAPPTLVSEDTSVYDAIVNLYMNDVGTLFVESNGQLMGAVSRKDFLKIAIGSADIHKIPVAMIMTRMPNIIFVEKEDTVYLAAQKIIDHEIDCIPVVERFFSYGKEMFKIVGRISKTSITKLFVSLGEIHK